MEIGDLILYHIYRVAKQYPFLGLGLMEQRNLLGLGGME